MGERRGEIIDRLIKIRRHCQMCEGEREGGEGLIESRSVRRRFAKREIVEGRREGRERRIKMRRKGETREVLRVWAIRR
jgi:hypothetical protein